MRAENLSVAAAFGLSYADLTAGQQRLFRRLGLVPGPSFDAYAAAALDGTSLEQARRCLDELYDQHLITEPAPGRYQLHDLLREHARALAAADDPAESDAAAGRLLDYYLHTALAAGRHFATGASRPPPAARPPAGPGPRTCPPSGRRPPGWRPSARTCTPPRTTPPAARGPCHAIAIPAAIGGFLTARGHWDQSAALHQTALTAARQAGDRLGEADTLSELGVMQRRDRRLPGRRRQPGPGSGAVRRRRRPARPGLRPQPAGLPCSVLTGDYPAAAASHQQALALARSARRPAPPRPTPSTHWAWCSS